MPSEQDAERTEQTNWRIYLAMASLIVSLAFGSLAFFAHLEAGGLRSFIDPAGTSQLPWWVLPAAVVSIASGLYSLGIQRGHLHPPRRSQDEIIDEVVGDDR